MIIRVVNKHSHVACEKDYYIGRPGTIHNGRGLGNPYSHVDSGNTIKVASRIAAVQSFTTDFYGRLSSSTDFRMQMNQLIKHAEKYGEVNLVCWCDPEPCHGIVIAEYLDEVIELQSKVIDRASGLTPCHKCGKNYYSHPASIYHISYDGELFMTRLCDGRYVKL